MLSFPLPITFKTRYPELLLWQNVEKYQLRHESVSDVRTLDRTGVPVGQGEKKAQW